MDHSNLRVLEGEVKQGIEVCVARIFYQHSKKSEKIIFDSKIIRDVSEPLRSEPLHMALKSIYSGMIVSGKLADVRDINVEPYGPVKLAVEILRPKLRLIVFGAGHVGQAVALVGALLGFDVLAVDDRPEFASRKRLPDPRINILVGDYLKVIRELNLETNSAVVIVTRGHQFDEACLRGVIRSGVGYLGMIGSKRRVLSVTNSLEKDGYSKEDFEKLHAPIGLRIGAKSPQEIAIAILAEIISFFNGAGLKQ